MTSVDEQKQVATWFRRRGFTSLLEGTQMRSNAHTLARSLTVVLILVMVLTMPPANNTPVWMVPVNLALLVMTWIGLNLARHRRPLAPINHVGMLERAAFIVIPSISAGIEPAEPFTLDDIELSALEVKISSIIGMAMIQMILYGIVALVVRSGVVHLWPWLQRQIITALAAASASLGRSMPLLLGVVGLFYFTAELWQAVGRLASWGYPVLLLLFIGSSVLFLQGRSQLDLDELAHFEDEDALVEQLDDTPLRSHTSVVALPASCPLDRRQEKDLRIVATFARLTVVMVVSVAVFCFFISLGAVTINAEVVKAWSAADPSVLWTWETSRRTYNLTWEHLRVAGFLAVFAGFYFSLVSRTDPSLKADMRDTAEETVREACAARLVALARFPYQQPVPAAAVNEDADPSR